MGPRDQNIASEDCEGAATLKRLPKLTQVTPLIFHSRTEARKWVVGGNVTLRGNLPEADELFAKKSNSDTAESKPRSLREVRRDMANAVIHPFGAQ
jgi:hypothetical protein